MTPKTPEELENLKLETFLKNQPSFIAKILGSLKKGKKEKQSDTKTRSNHINIKKALAKRWPKASQTENSNENIKP